MKALKFILITIIILASWASHAQTAEKYIEVKNPDKEVPRPFDKKWLFGMDVSFHWSTLKGSQLAKDYFYKPNIGFTFQTSYFPRPYLGFSIGLGFQQMGAGVTKHLVAKVTNSVDSTNRERLRFNTFILPISVNLRTPHDVLFKGCRIGGTFSVVPVIVHNVHDVYNSLEPYIVYLDYKPDVSSSYYKSDLLFQLAAGPEFETGTGLIKMQLFYNQGTSNVYAANQGNAHVQMIGFRLSLQY